MDYDELANVSMNFTYDVREMPLGDKLREIGFTLVTLLSSAADVLIIYSILRFKRMQTVRNLLILNWVIADFLFQFLNEAKFNLLLRLLNVHYYSSLYCIYEETEAVYMTAAAMFVFILSINYIYKRITETNLKFVVGIIWGIFIICHFALITICTCGVYFPFHGFTFMAVFGIVFSSYFVKLCMYTVRRMQKKEKHAKLRYILTSVYGFSWFLSATCLFFHALMYRLHIFPFFLLLTVLLCYTNPFMNVFLLAKYDKNFRLCFLHVVRRSSPEYVKATVTYDEDSEDNVNIVTSLDKNVDGNQ